MISEETDKELPYLPIILFHKVRTSCVLFRAQIVMALWTDIVCLCSKTLIGKSYCKRKLQYDNSFAEHLFYFSLTHSRSWIFCGKLMVYRLAFFIHICNGIRKAIAVSVRPFYTLLKSLVVFLPQSVGCNVLDCLVEVAFNGVVVLFPHVTIVVGELGSPFHI